jgi:dihydroneopterin aldolase
MTQFAAKLDGLVPAGLAPRTRKIMLEDYAIPVDIGFHEFEVGKPQRLLITVEVWLDAAAFVESDREADAWNYDFLRLEIAGLAGSRRFNLQETLAHGIYDLVAARRGVTGIRVAIRKPDVYSDCAAVGVELMSF